MKKELATMSQEAANMESRLTAEVSCMVLHPPWSGIAGRRSPCQTMGGPLQPAPSAGAILQGGHDPSSAFAWPGGFSRGGPKRLSLAYVQVANSRSTKAENTTLQNELSALQEQLSTSASQLEAEQATSENPFFPSLAPGCDSVVAGSPSRQDVLMARLCSSDEMLSGV